MGQVRKVPSIYVDFNAAHAAASPGDVIYFEDPATITWPLTLTKAVHLVCPLEDGVEPVASSSSGTDKIALQITDWGDVSQLLIEGFKFVFSQYRSAIYITQSIPEGRSVLVNRCHQTGGASYFLKANIAITYHVTTQNCYFNTYGDLPYRTNDGLPAGGTLNILNTETQEAYRPSCPTLFDEFIWDVVATPTAGYGPAAGAARFGDLGADSYSISGAITDIPGAVDINDFEIRLYAEVAPDSNDMSMAPLDVTGIDAGGNWSFDLLPLDRRYGVLIQPPDGMQGHWLRWYTPQ